MVRALTGANGWLAIDGGKIITSRQPSNLTRERKIYLWTQLPMQPPRCSRGVSLKVQNARLAPKPISRLRICRTSRDGGSACFRQLAHVMAFDGSCRAGRSHQAAGLRIPGFETACGSLQRKRCCDSKWTKNNAKLIRNRVASVGGDPCGEILLLRRSDISRRD